MEVRHANLVDSESQHLQRSGYCFCGFHANKDEVCVAEDSKESRAGLQCPTCSALLIEGAEWLDTYEISAKTISRTYPGP